jgi:hypothetical protein
MTFGSRIAGMRRTPVGTHTALVVAALLVAAVPPVICQTQILPKQEVTLGFPDGKKSWFVTDTCNRAVYAAVDNWNVTTKFPYELDAVAIVDDVGVTARGECLRVTVQPDGPSGWLFAGLARSTPEQKRKGDALRAAAEAKAKQAQAEKEASAAAAAKAAAEERQRVRATCAEIYKRTADKRVGDLTVKEDQQVRACQALGLYPPR